MARERRSGFVSGCVAVSFAERENTRLRQKALQPKDEIARMTGRPIQLTAEERQRLAESDEGIDPDRLEEISVIHPKEFIPKHHDARSTQKS